MTDVRDMWTVEPSNIDLCSYPRLRKVGPLRKDGTRKVFEGARPSIRNSRCFSEQAEAWRFYASLKEGAIDELQERIKQHQQDIDYAKGQE